MSILGSTPITVSSKALSNMISRGKTFFELNGKTIHFNLETEDDYRQAYLQCAPLKAVVNRRAQYFVNAKHKIINKNNENELRGDYARDLIKLLKKPNVLQSGKQFKAQQNIYIDLFGYCPVLKVTPVGMPTVVKSMWNLPPWLFDIDYTGNWYQQTELKGIYKQFYLNWNEEKRPLDMNNVFLILDNSIGTQDDSNLLMPDSRTKSLEFAISNDIAANKSLNTIITKKGAIGILSNNSRDVNGSIPMDEDERETVQNDFRRFGLTGQEWQVIITDAALQWQSMSYPVRDLMLFETMSASMIDICDGMGMYTYIMGNKLGAGTTFTNLNEAKKAQYQDFIIPDDEARTEQLSNNLIPEDQNAYIKVDYSHIEVLQESEKSKAEALKEKGLAYKVYYELGLMTRNQILEKLGENKVPGIQEFDLYNFQIPPKEVNNLQQRSDKLDEAALKYLKTLSNGTPKDS